MLLKQNISKRDAFCHYIITKATVVLTLHIAFNINKLKRNFVFINELIYKEKEREDCYKIYRGINFK